MRDLLDFISGWTGCSLMLIAILAIIFLTVKAIMVLYGWIFQEACKTLDNIIQILVGGSIGALIGLGCIGIYWWNLNRKTNPDEDDIYYTDNQIRKDLSLLNGSIRANRNRLDWQEKAINELLIKTEIVEVVGHIQIPDGASYDQLDELIKPWKKQGYLVQGNGSTITIFKLPFELTK